MSDSTGQLVNSLPVERRESSVQGSARSNGDVHSNVIPFSAPLRSLQRNVVRALNTASSYLNTRLNFARKAGLTFQGMRNIDRALGRLETITPANYIYRYDRSFAKTIVDKLPRAAWRVGCELVEDEDPSISTPWEVEVDALFTRLNIWEVLKQVHIESRKGRYGAIVLTVGSENITDSYGALDTELIPLRSPDHLLRLTPYNEHDLEITKKEKNKQSPRFGWPVEYTLHFEDGARVKIHYSRVIHLSASFKQYHAPVLEAPWDDLDDLDKSMGGVFEQIWQGKSTLWKLVDETNPAGGLPFESNEFDAGIGGGDLQTDYEDKANKSIQDAIRLMSHDAVKQIILRNVEAHQLGGDPPDISNNLRWLFRKLAATTNYAERVLLGSEEGKLAGEQDSAEQQAVYQESRDGECTKYTRLLVDRLIELRALSPAPHYSLKWGQVDRLSATDKANVVKGYAKANKDNPEGAIATIDEIREVVGWEELEEQPGSINGNQFNQSNQLRRSNTLDPDAPAEVVLIDEVVNEYQSDIELLFNINVSTVDVDDAVDSLIESFESIESIAESVVIDAGERGLDIVAQFSTNRSLQNVRRELQIFDPTSPRIVSFIDNYLNGDDGVLNDLTDSARYSMTQLINESTSRGWTVAQTTRRMSNSIGLASNQIDWVLSLSGKLHNAQPGDRITYANQVIKIPDTGITDALINKHIDGYIDRLLLQRKERFSRSILARLANEGLHESYRQADERGELPDNVYRVYLKNTDRHADRDGQLVRIGESFPVEPGADPNCSCSQGLQVVD